MTPSIAGSELSYTNETMLHPIAAASVLVLGAAVLALPRAWAVLPFIIAASFVSTAQRLVIGGFDFNLLRLLVLFAWIRMIARQEYRGFRWQPLDLALIAWAIVGTLAYTFQQETVSAFVNRLGNSFTALGLYFSFRTLISSWRDVVRISVTFAAVAIPVSVLFLVEKTTGRNLFSIFGGVPEETLVRGGRRRCQGAYTHPIIAGCFWAAVLPLMGALWWLWPSLRKWAVMGVASGLAIIFLCASSTPVAAVAAACLGAALFRFRKRMRWIVLSVALSLAALHVVMRAPVWHLISRIDIVGGSTGHHRYKLIDAAITNFSEWALVGVETTAHWGHGLHDVTNQYVLEGVRGGFLTLLLFVITLALAFRAVGRATRMAEGSTPRLALCWAVGVSLGVHAVSFLAVSYFGQSVLLWYLSLALAASIWDIARREAAFERHARPRRPSPSDGARTA